MRERERQRQKDAENRERERTARPVVQPPSPPPIPPISEVDRNLASAKAGIPISAEPYTDESWERIEVALSLEESSDEEKVAKTEAILNAISGLVTRVDQNLRDAMDNVPKDSGLYTEKSWQLIENALQLPEETDEEKVAKTEAILDAISGLVTRIDQNLMDAKNSVPDDSGLYTDESWLVLITALEMAEGTDEEKIVKTEAILEAIRGLVTIIDWNLASAKNSVPSDSVLYTEESWLMVEDALQLPEETDEERIAKTEAILDAISELVTRIDQNLWDAKNSVPDDSGLYTDESWFVLINALELAEGTDEEKIVKTEAILDAIRGLVTIVDWNLASAKGSVPSDSGLYTDESWLMVENALELPEGTDEEKVAKTEAILDAIRGLVTIVDWNLANAKGSVPSNSGLYTEESWLVVENALELPERTDEEKVAKTEAILDAIRGLVTRIDQNLMDAKNSVPDDSGLYTDESWLVLITALELAEGTDEEKIAKTEAILEAILGLVTIIDWNLASAKNRVPSDSGLYTEESWLMVENALQLPEGTDEEKVAKIGAILDAISGLVTRIDQNLWDAKKSVPDDSGLYTVESWLMVENALQLPEETDEEKVAKTGAILDAISGLVTRIDQNLWDAKNSVPDDSGLYTDESWMVLITALELAEGTDEEKIVKTEAILEAIHGLVTIVDWNLASAKGSVPSDSGLYTEESWLMVESAMELPEETDEEKVAKTEAILDAIRGLVTIVDWNLASAKGSVPSDSGLYTEESWLMVKSALELPEETDEEKVAKTEAILDAIRGLVTIVDWNLASAKGSVPSDSGLYTVESWLMVESALELPEETDEERSLKLRRF
ncbi:hypothetical protein QNH10_19020 [Sporosarcina thermotolerans]|uniref:hypothetical protein n=1 Tax=Sporosarcina thermotolerans TaxID=633404 RepID=UPI0024BC6382|nr:hypothetical protein [Sporosarcina thermotolerans]WHT48095.1 hypothetical protein QNH10_19020 [Sporosarcina thermotolerans]